MTDNTEKLIKILDRITVELEKATEEADKIQFKIGKTWVMHELFTAYSHIVKAKQDARLISRGHKATLEYWDRGEVAE